MLKYTDNQEFGIRLRKLLATNNVSQAELARKIDISIAAMQRYVNGRIPESLILYSLSKELKTTMEYLLVGLHTPIGLSENEEYFINQYNFLSDEAKNKIHIFMEISNLKSADIVSLDNYILKEDSKYTVDSEYSVPVLGYSAAGSPITAIENVLTFIETTIPNINFALYIKGTSMEPLIKDGDAIFIRRTQSIENGEIGIIKIGEDVTCKKFYDYSNRVELHSINPSFQPIVYEKDDLTNIQIIGKVLLTDFQKTKLFK